MRLGSKFLRGGLVAALLVGFTVRSFAARPDAEVVAKRDAEVVAKRMVERFADAWNRADGRAYGENYWPDAELVDPSGVIHAGREAIVRTHLELWAGPFKATQQRVSVRRITVLCPTAMVVDFDAELSGVRDTPAGVRPPPDGIVRAHLKHVMLERQGTWKVISAQNTLFSVEPQRR